MCIETTSSSRMEQMSSLNEPLNEPQHKRVSFSNIEIAEYVIGVGDNPTAQGVPISLTWECDSKNTYDFEEYEASKPDPRSKMELKIPPEIRNLMLSQQGVTAREIHQTISELDKIKISRNKSIRNQKWDKVHFLIEQSQRKLKRVTSLTMLSSSTPKQDQRKLKRVSSLTMFSSSPPKHIEDASSPTLSHRPKSRRSFPLDETRVCVDMIDLQASLKDEEQDDEPIFF